MGNFNNSLNTHRAVISLGSPKETAAGLEKLMEFDLDFTENEEYFRKDTLKKGFRNEAHRVAVENSKKPLKNETDLENTIQKILGKIFDSSYYDEWDFTLIRMNGEKYTVIVSYTN